MYVSHIRIMGTLQMGRLYTSLLYRYFKSQYINVVQNHFKRHLKQIYLTIDWTLIITTILGQNRPGIMVTKWVLHTFQIPRRRDSPSHSVKSPIQDTCSMLPIHFTLGSPLCLHHSCRYTKRSCDKFTVYHLKYITILLIVAKVSDWKLGQYL